MNIVLDGKFVADNFITLFLLFGSISIYEIVALRL